MQASADPCQRGPCCRCPPKLFSGGELEATFARELEPLEPSRVRVIDAWPASDWVVVRIAHAFRRTSPLPGFPHTKDREALVYELWLLRFVDGLVVESHVARNRLSMWRQLGILKPGELVTRRKAQPTTEQ